jgi:hypothetical protein
MSSTQPQNIPSASSSKSKNLASSKKENQSHTSASLFLSTSVSSSLYGPGLSSIQAASPSRNVDDEDVRKALDQHLVPHNPPSPTQELVVGSVGSISHNLVGGAITRDIYKWKEDYDESLRNNRSRSVPDLYSLNNDNEDSMAAISQPGGFRRHFMRARAEQEGREPPNFFTQNFLDFLALYGNFAGQELSDSDDEYEEEQNRIRRLGQRAGSEELGGGPGEETPLIMRRRPAPSTHATASANKAFFLLVRVISLSQHEILTSDYSSSPLLVLVFCFYQRLLPTAVSCFLSLHYALSPISACTACCCWSSVVTK